MLATQEAYEDLFARLCLVSRESRDNVTSPRAAMVQATDNSCVFFLSSHEPECQLSPSECSEKCSHVVFECINNRDKLRMKIQRKPFIMQRAQH